MKKINALTLPIAACLLFASPTFANGNPSGVAREIAKMAKIEFQKAYGNLPIKVNDKMSLTNISSKGASIVYDYRYRDKSTKYTQNDVDIYSQLMFDKRMCDDDTFVSFFTDNDIDFVYRYTFNDKKTLSSSFYIEDACED